MTPREFAFRYVKNIRNEPKQAYAARYLRWRLGTLGNVPEPDRSAYPPLGTMAAQAVRMNIDAFLQEAA